MTKSEISIAVVKDSKARYLISLRSQDVHQGGKWEFPGGKVEKGEKPEDAMCRELREETGLIAIEYQLFELISFDYGDKALDLYFYLVTQCSGKAHGKEGQPIKWVNKSQLVLYEFPEANIKVIEKL